MDIKSILITGANRGIGFEFVRQLVEASPPPDFVFAGCRDPDRAKVGACYIGIDYKLKSILLVGRGDR